MPAAQRPRMFAAQTGAWRGTGPRPTVKAAIKMARDRPSPYGERGRFLISYRSAGPLGCHTRRRAGFPRDLSPFAENARSPETTDVCCSDWRMARDRFSQRPTVKAAIKHGEGQALALRKGRRFFIVARGPSDATRASERVSSATLSDL